MDTDFPFVVVPPELRGIVGEPAPGTRIYRSEGSHDDCGAWFEAIHKHLDGVGLSPGGVSMYVPVSRAAVHKRIKDGKLTAFTFHITRETTGFLGKKRKAKEQPYILLSIAECKAWAEEFKRRRGYQPENQNVMRLLASEDEPKTEQEIKEADEFVEIDPKDRQNKNVEYSEPGMSRGEVVDLVNRTVREAIHAALTKVLPGKLGEKKSRKVEQGHSHKGGKASGK
jgi:hypothetical protein